MRIKSSQSLQNRLLQSGVCPQTAGAARKHTQRRNLIQVLKCNWVSNFIHHLYLFGATPVLLATCHPNFLAKDFALSMVSSADLGHLDGLLRRVDTLNNDGHLRDMQVTYEEFMDFAELRKKLQPFALALFSSGKVNGLLTKEDFQRPASQVCGIPLSDNVVDITFHVFDFDGDGHLSSKEFVRVLHRREKQIGQPRETGMMGALFCFLNRSSSNDSFERLVS